MRPVFTTEPLANALFVCTALVWVLGEFRQALRRRSDASTHDRYSFIFLRVCIAASVPLAFVALRVTSMSFGDGSVIPGIALLLMWSGIALRWWSFWTLGRYFTFSVMTSADQPVITNGPYVLLRHPSYAGILLALAGIGVAFGNGLSLAALLALPAVGLIYRIHVEESALSATLGTAYVSYAKGRKRIIPLVW